jgi:hypothetical protein
MTSQAAVLTWETNWPKRVLNLAEAVRYIDAVGFCMLYPVKKIPLPSLYYAVTRRNPHSEFVWDKCSVMVWKWKDELPRRKRAFYTKLFKGRGTLISLKLLPAFLSARQSIAGLGDHALFYERGHISDDSRVIWQTLQKHGPMPTLELRHACKLETKAGNARFKRAMLQLETKLIVVHCGTEQETRAWASGRFDLTSRVFGDQMSAAGRVSPEEARIAIARKFLSRKGTQPVQLARLFGWNKQQMAEITAAASTQAVCS